MVEKFIIGETKFETDSTTNTDEVSQNRRLITLFEHLLLNYQTHNKSTTDRHKMVLHQSTSLVWYKFVSPILGVDSRGYKRTAQQNQPYQCCLACFHEMARSTDHSVYLQVS